FSPLKLPLPPTLRSTDLRRALALLHRVYRAVQQDGAADHLDVVMPLTDGPVGRLAHQGEDARDQLAAEPLAAQALAQLGGVPRGSEGHTSELPLRTTIDS